MEVTTGVNNLDRRETITGETQEGSPTLPTSIKNPDRQAGTLARLSISMRRHTRRIAASRPLLLIYDNINMLWKVAEQIIGRTGESKDHSYHTMY